MESNVQTDEAIILKIISGDTDQYEILIRRYNSFLYKIGRSYSFNHQDTEDLMQETYISAYSNLSKFENRASFKTWITRIMLNHCYQKKQKNQRLTTSFLGDEEILKPVPMAHSSHDKNTVINKELSEVIEHAIHDIPETYRSVFVLRELNSLSTIETAEALNISESNVKVRMNRARKMLQSKIFETYTPEQVFEFNCIYCDAMVERVMSSIKKMK